jgi:hypothetical protein
MPYGTAVNSLAPQITLSPNATVNPASGTARDFSAPQTYRVTAEDGTWADYTVTVIVRSGEKAITAFRINGTAGIINGEAKTITVTMPYGTAVNSLAPQITLSPKAAVNPPSGETLDFSAPQTYRVTAEDETWADYTVTVICNGMGTITIHQPPLGEQDISFTLQTGEDGVVSAGIEGTGYSNYQWYGDDVFKGTDSVLALTGYAPGTHTLLVIVYRNGIPYSARTTFTVE